MSKSYKQDSQMAKKAAYQSAKNPFEEGTRLHRLFVKWRTHHDRMEDQLADMASVYGYSWPLQCKLDH
jgi:hypothetical protein